MSYLFYKHYLHTHILPPEATGGSKPPARKSSGKHPDERFIEERERCIDEELAASMPASDPPSWTLGGSAISKRRKH